MANRFATIDTGTNTILMLIAATYAGQGFRVLRNEHRIARLGEGLDKSGVISTVAVERACHIFDEYAEICREENVQNIRVVCTSAMRRAANADEVIKEFRRHIDAEFSVISGEEEAYLSFFGTVDDDRDSTVIDVGGGSTEFIRGKADKIIAGISLDTGAVRCTEQFIKQHPPAVAEIDNIRKSVREMMKHSLKELKSENLYAVAGTPVTIASVLKGYKYFDENILNEFVLTKTDIENVFNIFVSNDLDYLINELGIHRLRADVITAGTLILSEALTALEADSVIVSTKGLRYGVMKRLTNKILV